MQRANLYLSSNVASLTIIPLMRGAFCDEAILTFDSWDCFARYDDERIRLNTMRAIKRVCIHKTHKSAASLTCNSEIYFTRFRIDGDYLNAHLVAKSIHFSARTSF